MGLLAVWLSVCDGEGGAREAGKSRNRQHFVVLASDAGPHLACAAQLFELCRSCGTAGEAYPAQLLGP